MKILSLSLFLLIAGLGSASASGPLADLQKVDCKGSNGDAFFADKGTQLVLASSEGFRDLSSSHLEEPAEVGVTTWSEGRLYGFGGSAIDAERNRLTLVTVLFHGSATNQLPDEGVFTVHFADAFGTTNQSEMSCQLQFNAER